MTEHTPTLADWNRVCTQLFGRPWAGIVRGLSSDERALLRQRIVAHFRAEPSFQLAEREGAAFDGSVDADTMSGARDKAQTP
jgi:hypothetical protein